MTHTKNATINVGSVRIAKIGEKYAERSIETNYIQFTLLFNSRVTQRLIKMGPELSKHLLRFQNDLHSKCRSLRFCL